MKRLLEFAQKHIYCLMFECMLDSKRKKTFFGPENISSTESPDKSPQFRLIKRTSRAIYNLPSFVCFVLIYMNDVLRWLSTKSCCLCGFKTQHFELINFAFACCIRNSLRWLFGPKKLQIFDSPSRNVKLKSTLICIRIQIKRVTFGSLK